MCLLAARSAAACTPARLLRAAGRMRVAPFAEDEESGPFRTKFLTFRHKGPVPKWVLS